MTYQVLAFAPNYWDSPWMNRQQILSRLAAHVPVSYSNGPWFVWDRKEPRWKAAPINGAFLRYDGVWVDRCPRYLLRWPRHRHWDALMLGAYGRRLRRMTERLGPRRRIAYVFHPTLAEAAKSIGPEYIVYHAYDLYEGTPGWTEAHARQQRELIACSHLVIASSEAIASALRREGAREALVVPNGADSETFVTASEKSCEIPADIGEIPGPRIGYTGNLNRKVDFPLMQRLAERHEDWQFVIIGGLMANDDRTRQEVALLERLPNVHFLGNKDRRELPFYMAAMDVNIMCYRSDRAAWTPGIYPLKLHEYLSVGQPVVSSDLAAVHEFSNVVAIATNQTEWEREIEVALAGEGRGSRAQRQQTGLENSWDARVGEIKARLDALVDIDRAPRVHSR